MGALAHRVDLDVFGRGVDGPLAGRRLTLAPQATSFWFSWSHFHPETGIARPRS